MSPLPQGNWPRHPLRWSVLLVLCLASLAAVAGKGHGGGGHGGGKHGGNRAAHGIGHRGGHFAGHHGAHHHDGRVFLGFGLGYWPWYYPPYAVPSSPPVYVERTDEDAAPQSAYWYYCADPQGYYPYVAQCPGGWQRVRPAP